MHLKSVILQTAAEQGFHLLLPIGVCVHESCLKLWKGSEFSGTSFQDLSAPLLPGSADAAYVSANLCSQGAANKDITSDCTSFSRARNFAHENQLSSEDLLGHGDHTGLLEDTFVGHT